MSGAHLDQHPDEPLRRLVEAQLGLLTSRQLRELGFGAHSFDDRVNGRHWQRISDEVMRRAGTPAGRGSAILVPVLDTVRELRPEWVTTLDPVPIVRPPLLALQLFAQHRFDTAERRVDTIWSLRLSALEYAGFVEQKQVNCLEGQNVDRGRSRRVTAAEADRRDRPQAVADDH